MSALGSPREPDDAADWLGTEGFLRAITGYDESVELLEDPRLAPGVIGIFDAMGVRSGPFRDVMGASLENLHGEEHRRTRTVVASQFAPAVVDALRPALRDTAHRLIDGSAGAGRCEVVRGFAWPYVARTLAAFLGFTPEEAEPLSPALRQVAIGTKDLRQNVDRCVEGVLALVDAGNAAIDSRRRQPMADLLSGLATAVDGGQLSPLGAQGILAGLLVQGQEATASQLSIMVDVVAKDPELWEAVGSGELGAAPVVEEVLRVRSTHDEVVRRVSETFEFRGVELREGEHLTISTGRASHDPRVGEDPQRFDPLVERPHLAFGAGPHQCLGAGLARAQLQEALHALTTRISCPRVVAKVDPPRSGLRGPSHLQIAFTAPHAPPAR